MEITTSTDDSWFHTLTQVSAGASDSRIRQENGRCAEGQNRTGDTWFFRSGPGPARQCVSDGHVVGTARVDTAIAHTQHIRRERSDPQARAFAYMVVGGSGT